MVIVKIHLRAQVEVSAIRRQPTVASYMREGIWGNVWNGESEPKRGKQGIHAEKEVATEMGDW